MTFLVTALQSEARPLIERFELRGTDASSPFRVYRGDEVLLVVSGVGRIASAAATAYAFAREGEPKERPWVNVGIAGHASAAVGSAWLARKISEAASERSWFPSLVFEAGIATAEVVTVDRPESRFERDALYDMEASAFFATAARFTPVELVQVFKVVSDTRSAPAENLTAAQVSRLIEQRVEEVAELIRSTRELAAILADRRAESLDPATWIGGRHFTLSQRRQLVDLVRRLEVLEGQSIAPGPDERRAPDARSVLRSLEARLERQGVGF